MILINEQDNPSTCVFVNTENKNKNKNDNTNEDEDERHGHHISGWMCVHILVALFRLSLVQYESCSA